MKSGAKIHLKVLSAGKPEEAVIGLKNGSLRSLLIHLDQPHATAGPASDRIHGAAMVEASKRWVEKGRAAL